MKINAYMLFFAWILLALGENLYAKDPPYELTWGTEAPILSLGVAAYIFSEYSFSQMEPRSSAPSKEDLLPWDRPFAGTYHPSLDAVSDWTLFALVAFPLGFETAELALGNSSGSEAATFFLTAIEVTLWQSSVNLIVRSTRLWARPEIYRSGADRSRGESWGSFYSGHTGAAFSIAVLSGMWFMDKYPNSAYVPLVWGGSLALATTVGLLRIAAGKHYPTDVLAGALIGSAASYFVLRVHRSSRVKVAVVPGYIGASVSF
ncbi:MAG: phosphatase PAP2 family protein [Fibrobacter sp.]|jgi:membrane-associated phospholipid phosphatase|nr:phosphatase PAP2 family protein [Fibrobacter sp.]MDY6368816.1 phosphatase PAP2 family protein [Fibrobacter sp.]MDY6389484.1 phosphatase PAP2 family protein [Fibrobacter sp.]